MWPQGTLEKENATTRTVMTTIPAAAKIAKPAVCFGPIRLKAPIMRIDTIAQSPGLRQWNSRSCGLGSALASFVSS